jgi:hypothetical protein
LTFALVIVGSIVLGSQRVQTQSLRTELESARSAASELARLRAENQRLSEKQIPPAQLEALRADHAALPQLRAQVEALSKPTAP